MAGTRNPHPGWGYCRSKECQICNFLAILLVTFLGWLSDPCKGLSDLQLGDEKVTLNHLVGNLYGILFGSMAPLTL